MKNNTGPVNRVQLGSHKTTILTGTSKRNPFLFTNILSDEVKEKVEEIQSSIFLLEAAQISTGDPDLSITKMIRDLVEDRNGLLNNR